jgi:hypothetical protein
MRDPEGVLMNDLGLLGRAVSYPQTPSLAAAVTSRISPRPARAPAWGLAGVALATAIVALAVVAGTIAPARDAMADLFDRINIFEVRNVPEELPTDIRGEEMPLDQAQSRLGRPILLPAGGDGSPQLPSRVLWQELSGGQYAYVALFFEPSDGAPYLIFQTSARTGKGLGPGAQAQPVPGLGDAAYWLEGLRIVQLYDSAGNFIQETQRRTAANTLIWSRNEFVYRIEGDLSEEEAVQIARSLAPR